MGPSAFFSARATASTRPAGGALSNGFSNGNRGVSPASPQEASPGRIRVAMRPVRATVAARETSAAMVWGPSARRSQWLRGRASPSRSEASGASYLRWLVAWSPTMLTMPDPAFRALWMLARPLARPGPRCSRVEAGVCLMRKNPSAAPDATPSNRQSTLRMCGLSSALRKCISEVPGLAKQMSTPWETKVLTRLSAPFMCVPPKRFVDRP